jgi:hypothetical protein
MFIVGMWVSNIARAADLRAEARIEKTNPVAAATFALCRTSPMIFI